MKKLLLISVRITVFHSIGILSTNNHTYSTYYVRYKDSFGGHYGIGGYTLSQSKFIELKRKIQ